MKKELIAACVAEKQNPKYSLMEMYEVGFNRIIFAGAGMGDPRGPSDAFTLDELLMIANSEAFGGWSLNGKAWLWSAVDFLMELEQVARVEAKKLLTPAPRMGATATPVRVAVMLLACISSLAFGDTIEVKDGKGKIIVAIEQNKTAVNMRDAKGNIVATGTAGKGDAVTLLTPKGKIITVKKGAK